MIRLGVDIVLVSRLERALERWPRLADRVFTAGERIYAAERARPSEHLAGRFAAKEAVFKALGSGWPQVSWTDIEVVSNGGAPKLKLSGRARELAGAAQPALTISHDGGMAIAAVVIADESASTSVVT